MAKNGKVKKSTASKDLEYRAYKLYLQSLNLTCEEYEKRLKDWCRRAKY